MDKSELFCFFSTNMPRFEINPSDYVEDDFGRLLNHNSQK